MSCDSPFKPRSAAGREVLAGAAELHEAGGRVRGGDGQAARQQAHHPPQGRHP